MPRHTNYKDLHKLEGHKATFKCQLFDGSMWNRCEWKHEHNGLQNTAVISKTPDGHSYQVSSLSVLKVVNQSNRLYNSSVWGEDEYSYRRLC